MSGFAISSDRTLPLDYASKTESVKSHISSHEDGGQKANNVQDFAALASQPDVLSLIMNNQSVVKTAQLNTRMADISHSAEKMSDTRSSAPKHAQPPVEGGTDVTAASAPAFINVMGDMKLVEISNLLNVMLTKAEGEANKAGAKSLLRMVDAADRAGTKAIDAEKERMTGAITSGVMGIVGQGVMTGRTVKALGSEAKSITKNLGKAVKLEQGLSQNQSAIKNSADNMLLKNKSLDSKVKETMAQPHAESTAASSQLRQSHDRVAINTQKVRSVSDLGTQSVHAIQGVTDGSFNVEASKETKQADLARADQSVNNEIASTHQQTARKAAEAKGALNQAIEGAFNNNNSAASSIADRMR